MTEPTVEFRDEIFPVGEYMGEPLMRRLVRVFLPDTRFCALIPLHHDSVPSDELRVLCIRMARDIEAEHD